ncbi:uncharacterized protein LOC110060529 [Orbicella faveolata]|uniref:uncharacterized protein LOC110060529 n=1 Tax=Orbicella faveolata TaxID=48498 RepID=UPI0009E206FD|nr:uncharacterized protein LOC110060529 [Orbicella faveolata]XP_020622985.1 uncharacterized protein LOC110060529 [Orbicella faveolata]
MRHFLKVLISIVLIILLCSGVEGRKGKRPKNKNKPSKPSGGLKNNGEECALISGSSRFPWGHCALPVSCPGDNKLNCANGLHCCRNWTPHSDEGNISEEEYSAYLKLRDNLYH